MKPTVIAIAAVGEKNRAICANGNLLWHIPEDLKHFKEKTNGHPVIMGRKTWESLPEKYRPLSGRTNIVVTRNQSYSAPGASIATSLPEALSIAKQAPGNEEVFIIGGGELYTAALEITDRLYLTLIDDEKEGDTHFPEYKALFTKLISEQPHQSNDLSYRWVELARP